MPPKDMVQVLEQGGVTLVRVRISAILSDEEVAAFGEGLARVAEAPGRRVVLSFLGVHQLSSTALGKLVEVRQRLKETGGEMRLADIDPRIYEVFSITRLDKLFRIYEREEEALASFTPPSGAEA